RLGGGSTTSASERGPRGKNAGRRGDCTPPPHGKPEGAHPPQPESPPSVTHHEISVNGKSLRYTATAATMPLKDQAGTTEAHIFYIAYTLDGGAGAAERPLTFAFNGGRARGDASRHPTR